MKKTLFAIALLLMTAFAAYAQNYMVVNTETIFKSVTSYTNAIAELDRLGEQYQQDIDRQFEELERDYNAYQLERARLTEAARQVREDAIINREREILARQQEIFGQEGTLLERRVELLKPIQDSVFNAINTYAANNGYQLVLDVAANPTVLYYAPGADKTQEIINLVR